MGNQNLNPAQFRNLNSDTEVPWVPEEEHEFGWYDDGSYTKR